MWKSGDKPKAILLDIEGTTTDSKFISKKLFPFLRENLANFLKQTYYSAETKDTIQRLRIAQMSGSHPGMPTIVEGTKEQVVSSVVDNIKWQMNNKSMSSEMKYLELLCWLWAYESDLIKSHVFDDVSYSLHNWKVKSGIKICTFSSGMVLAQKLLFAKTNHGNIGSLVDNFFDGSLGSKLETESYKLISNTIGVEVNQILFITDDPNEAKTAISAGLKSVIIKRPGNKANDEYPEIPRIKSFEEIKF